MLGVDDCSIILKYWNIRTSQYTNLTVCVEAAGYASLSLSLSLLPRPQPCWQKTQKSHQPAWSIQYTYYYQVQVLSHPTNPNLIRTNLFYCGSEVRMLKTTRKTLTECPHSNPPNRQREREYSLSIFRRCFGCYPF